jgi:dihydroorotase
MKKIAILGGRIVDPANQIDQIGHLTIAEGKVIGIQEKLIDFTPDLTIDATNLIVCPGLVDLNADLLMTQMSSSERFWEQRQQAFQAGITHIATSAFIDDRSLQIPEIEYYAKAPTDKNMADISLIGPLTENLEGTRLSELQLLTNAGCIGFSNGKLSIINTLVKRRCYDYAAMLGAKIYINPEDAFLAAQGMMHEGEVSLRLGISGIPTLAETIALTQELLLTEETQVSAHFRHLTSAKSVELLARAQQNGLKITSDVAIHHLYLTDIDVELDSGLANVRPPLRSSEDLRALRDGVKNGIIHAITSDHIYRSAVKKDLPFQDAQPGIASWPVLLPLVIRLSEETDIPLSTALACVTHNPATILGIDAGHLSEGAKANVLIFDPKEEWTLQQEELNTFGHNNPFKNWLLKGRVKYVLNQGLVLDHLVA